MRLKRWQIAVAGVALIPLLLGGVYVSVYQYGRYIPVNRETTHITGPLDGQGRLDFGAAIEIARATGTTPQNNAAILIIQAAGYSPPSLSIDTALGRLGAFDQKRDVQPLKDSDHIYQQFKLTSPTDEEIQAKAKWLGEMDELLRSRPWRVSDFPEYGELMQLNAPAFVLIEEGVVRSNFYWPTEDPTFPSVGFSSPFNNLRRASDLLRMRSMMHAGQDNAAAIRDVLTAIRLGNAVAAEPTLLSSFVGGGIVAAGAAQARQLADSLSAAEATALADAIDSIGPARDIFDAVFMTERLFVLAWQYDMLLRKEDPHTILQQIVPLSTGGKPPALNATIVRWMPVQHARGMELTNQRFDTDLMGALKTSTNYAELSASFQKCKQAWQIDAPVGYSDLLYGRMVFKLAMPAIDRLLAAQYITEAQRRQSIVWLRLIAHQKQHGQFPATLGEAGADRPYDPFSGKPFLYEKTAEGFELRSVGPDMADDRTLPPAARTEDGEDRVVRYPLGADQ
jgi:hypothetical protein